MEGFKDLSLAFDRFSIENLRDVSKNTLTLSVFEIEKCSFFLNRSEFHQKLINTIRGPVRNQRAYSEIGNKKREHFSISKTDKVRAFLD